MAIILLLVALGALLRIPGYTKLSIMPDEILYSDYAFSIIAFDWGWPPEQMLAQPPLFPYSLSLLTYLFDGSLEIFRLVPIFFGILDVIALYFLGKIIYNRKVGILSALFLSFSSYHILYSRTLMLETMLIFFMLVSMYFFWRAYSEDRLIYAAIAGVFIGLANNTKYSAFLLYLIFVSYLLWVRRRGFHFGLRPLVEKKFLVMIITSFLVFLPVLADLYLYGVDPFYWQLFDRYKLQFAGYKTLDQFGIANLIIHGFDNYVGLLMDATVNFSQGFYIKSGSIGTMSLPWLILFEVAAYILLPVTVLYYFYFFMRTQPRESFLLIAFLFFNAFVAAFSTRFQYYLLWNVPLFFIMLSSIAVNFANKIKLSKISEQPYLKGVVRVSMLLITGVFLLSYIYIGSISPFVNESIKAGYEKHIIKIKNSIDQNDSIATDKISMLYYYLNDYNMKFIPVLPLYKIEQKNQKRYLAVDLDLLNTIKPRYILVADYSFLSYATNYDRMMIQKDYELISYENDVLLYKRKTDQI